MIRRRYTHPTRGTLYALITQDDHARLAGELCRHLGTSRYPRPARFDALVRATHLHDAGWPVHDIAPTLNKDGRPSDVFETSRETSMRVWPGAPEAAAAEGPWVELLVSLHILALSAYATSDAGFNHDRPATDTLPARFAMNKFQHREIERQERLRRELGLSVELPLTLGLSDPDLEPPDPREDEVRQLLAWLQAMDLASLALCCTEPPQAHTHDIYPTPEDVHGGGERLSLRREENDLIVSPWPFAVEKIRLEIPAVLVPARKYESEADLHRELASADRVLIPATVRPI